MTNIYTLPGGQLTVHVPPAGYEFVTSRLEILQADYLIEFAGRKSPQGFEPLSVAALHCIGRPAGELMDVGIVIARKIQKDEPVTPRIDDILNRRLSQDWHTAINVDTRLDIAGMYALSPVALVKRAPKDQVIHLMKQVREATLQKLTHSLFTRKDVEAAYMVGLEEPTATKITAAIEHMGHEIDKLAAGDISKAESIRQSLQILQNGLEFLQQSYATATEQAIENATKARLSPELIGTNKTLWYIPIRLTSGDRFDERIVYKSHHGKSWYSTKVNYKITPEDYLNNDIYHLATPEQIAEAGGDPTHNDWLP